MDRMNYSVRFQCSNGKQGGDIGQPLEVARFGCKGNAVGYAIWASKEYPSPNPNIVRVWEALERGKVIYRAG